VLYEILCASEFGRVGINVESENNSIKVISVMDKAPAAKAGVKANDRITHIDGQSLNGLALDQVVEKLRGPPDTRVKLTVTREGRDHPLEFSIVRAVIQMHAPQVQAEAQK
jgi:carboxyl-terminal processing protease